MVEDITNAYNTGTGTIDNKLSNKTDSPATDNDSEIKKDLDALKQKLLNIELDMEKKAKNQSKDLMSIFGIFSTIVIFLVTEVDIFKKAENVNQIIGFSFLLLSSLLIFSYFINRINSFIHWERILFFSLILLLLFLGIYFSTLSLI